MEQTYTQTQIIRFIYKDAPVTEYLEIENAIKEDKYLFSEYKSLLKAYKLLPKVSFYPSKKIVSNLLAQSALRT